MKDRFILASNSPRRKELLQQIGLSFVVDPADVDERVLPGETPEQYALRLAREKARVVSRRAEQGTVIAADTIVVLGGTVLGKPADEQDAKRMLRMLSGKMHTVITGLAVIAGGRELADISVTQVWFRDLTDIEIDAYAATGEPLDKAGGYGIQEKGALLVHRIAGCYFNVVGLPLSLLASMLNTLNLRIL